jgi:hypothetical protein
MRIEGKGSADAMLPYDFETDAVSQTQAVHRLDASAKAAIRINLPMTGILYLFSFFFSFQESD